nr:MAG TPA: hypothetical protein [Caudoviricetes sp.]
MYSSANFLSLAFNFIHHHLQNKFVHNKRDLLRGLLGEC